MEDTSLNEHRVVPEGHEHLVVPEGKVLIYTHVDGEVVKSVARYAGEVITQEEIDGGDWHDAFHAGLLDSARSRMSKD
jgi:hypothetical protein